MFKKDTMQENQFLYLVSVEKEGEGFWEIGLTKHLNPLNSNKFFLECYRKELIRASAAKEILNSIKIKIENLLNDLNYP